MLIEKNGPKQILMWTSAAVAVVGIHVGAGYLAASLQGDRNAVMGGPEAIMLEFAEEPMAPDVEDVSETIQEETVKDAPEELNEQEEETPQEVAEAEPEKVEPEPLKSDMVEEIKKPEPPKEPVKPKVEQRKAEPKKTAPKRDVKKAEKSQKATGPQIAAKKGPTFAAPTTNRSFGNNGRLVASWQNKVQRRIAYMASRAKRPGKAGRASAYVTFNFDQSGNITSARTSRSSGDPSIDALALQIVRKASPIPSPPEGWSGALTVPVEVR
ncbi:energy transducer TonB family protein [Bartonella sp. LJL80]